MRGGLAKGRNDDNALNNERRLMNAALAKLGQIEAAAATRQIGTAGGTGRLIFALDLTASREASLYQARIATAAMFETVKAIGAIAVKLIYYRGTDECRSSQWHDDPAELSASMRRLCCETGETQIARMLRTALSEKEKVSAVVFVGDHCEDNADELLALSETLGQKSLPLFVFHECADHDQRSLQAKPLFKRLAEASGGAYYEFKPDSGAVLRELLANLAAFSAAGREGVKKLCRATTLEGRQLQGRLLLGAASQPPTTLDGTAE